MAWNGLGEMFVSTAQGRVLRVDRTGLLEVFAGKLDERGPIGWGEPAAGAKLGRPVAVAVGADDTVYVRTRDSWEGDSVISVDSTGVVQPVVGRTCSSTTNPRDGEAAASRCLGTHASGLSIAPDGALLVTDSRHWILRLAPALPGFSTDSIAIPSTDGTEVYDFTSSGRHRRTLDALTGAVLWSFDYDTGGRLVKATDANGRATTIERGAGGRVGAIVAPGGQRTELETSADGWLTKVTRQGGATTRLSYGTGGLLTGQTDVQGGEHVYAYDADGRLISDRNPTGFTKTLSRKNVEGGTEVTVTETGGAATTYVRRTLPSGDEERVVTEPGGVKTTTVKTPANVTTQTRPDGTVVTSRQASDPRWGAAVPYVAEQVTKTPGGKTKTVTTKRDAELRPGGDLLDLKSLSETVREGSRMAFRNYDGESRTLETSSAEGRRTETVLDERGRVASFQPDVNTGDEPVTYGYDARGRITETKQGDRVERWEYDGRDRVVARVDARGKRTTYAYDDADQLVESTTPGGRKITYGSDARGRRTRVTLPGGAEHGLAYTPDGKDAGYDAPGDGGKLTRAYDSGRRLASTTLASGRKLDLDYDAAGRLDSQSFDAGKLGFGYDAGSGRLETLDRRTGTDSLVQRLAYGYDGSLVKSLTASGAADGAYAFTYDDRHELVSSELKVGTQTVTTALERDDDGLLVKEGAYAINRSGPAGAATRIADGKRALSIGYDTATGQMAGRSLSVGGTKRYDLAVERDAGGKIVKRTETVAGGAPTVTTYAYDNDGRLTEVKRNGTVVEGYDYDERGNRVARRIAGAPAEAATFDLRDRLLTRGATAYGSDDDGFVTTRGTQALEYSARGELLSATAGGVGVTYRYDALNRRVARTEGGKTERYLYGNPGDPHAITASIDGDGELTTYRYDDYGLLHALERGGKTYAVATDQVGTPVAVFDEAGALVKRVERDTWGVVTSDSAPAFALPFGYAGGLEDRRTGLVRFGFRDYDPAAGRWLARDPARFAGGQDNLYEYVGSDPVAHRDPSGLVCISASAYAGFGGGGEICIDKKGISSCVEGGIGVGVSGIGIKEGGPAAHTGLSTVIAAGVKVGAFGIGDSIEINPCGQTIFKVEAGAGPLKYAVQGSTTESGDIAYKDTSQASLDPSKWSTSKFTSTEVKAEAKIAGKYCATTMDM